MNRLSFLFALIAMTLAGCHRPDPDVVTLTYASPYPPGHPFSQADQVWMDWVQAQAHGRLKIKVFWGGSLLSSDESMEEIRHGVADIGLITPIYTLGGAHAQRAQPAFYAGVQTIDQQVELYKCLAQQFPALRHELKGLHVLAVQGGNFPGLITRDKPVHSLSDLKGMRIRAPSENLGVLRALGADPVNMSMNDVYPALAKGVIDGVIAPADTLKSLHFAEVTKYFTELRVSRGSYPARAMNEERWEQLPPDIRDILNRGEKVWEAALKTKLAAAERDGITFGRTHGVTFIPFPPAGQQRFDALFNREAQATARQLSKFHIDGMPIFTEAQRLIHQTPPGQPLQCPAPAGGQRETDND